MSRSRPSRCSIARPDAVLANAENSVTRARSRNIGYVNKKNFTPQSRCFRPFRRDLRRLACAKRASSTTELSAATFEQTVDSNDIVLIDWWAPWCGPCRTFAPVFEKASEKYTDIVFAKINTDDQQDLAKAFNIRSIPTLFIFREKVLLFAQAGSLPASALDQVIEKVRSLDMDEVRAKIAEEEAKRTAGGDEAGGGEAGGGEASEGA
ncbi:thioredoxin [Sorangium sp. So ce136]